MLTNKDIRVENGNIVINGDKYPLDGQSPEAIMQIVEDNSDTTPTENSDAPITSGGVFTALAGKQGTLTFDTVPTENSTNPVTSGGLFSALAGKQENLTVTDITASVTTDTTAVSEVGVYTYGNILYIYFKLNANITDQTFVITGLPKVKSGTGCVIPAFYMNRGDYNKGCICAITNATTSASVQFRCGDTPTGAGGTMYSAVCILDE